MTTTGAFPVVAVLPTSSAQDLSTGQYLLCAFGALLGIALVGAGAIEALFSLS